MASVKLGSIVSDIRGSIGGVVYSRNGGGAYAKARTCPTNPNSTRQQFVRSIMSSMHPAWLALLATVRIGWATYAKNVSIPNRLGDQINVSGYNMYCRTRAICELLGISMPAVAPPTFSLAEQDPTIAVVANGVTDMLSITFDALLGWANEVGGYLLVYQGIPQNGTINSYDGPFTYAGAVPGAASPPSSPAEIASVYNMTAGQKCFCQFRILRADGRLSTPFRSEVVVTGTPLVAPSAAGVYSGGVLTTTITFPQNMNQDVLPNAGDFKYTGGDAVGLAHTAGAWNSATELELTVTTAIDCLGTGALTYTPGTIPLITADGGAYEGFEVEEVVGES
jgi:hypothetical protein